MNQLFQQVGGVWKRLRWEEEGKRRGRGGEEEGERRGRGGKEEEGKWEKIIMA